MANTATRSPEEILTDLEKGVGQIGDKITGQESRIAEMVERVKAQEEATHVIVTDLAGVADKIKSMPQGRGGMPGDDTPEARSGFSMLQALRALHAKKHGPSDWNAPEDDAEKAFREKVMQGNLGPTGGFLIDDQYVNQIIPELEARAVLLQAGAQIFNVPGSVGNVIWPKETSSPSGAHVGEGDVIAEETPNVEQLIATPKRAVFLVRVSNDLLKMAAIAVDPWLRNRLMTKAGLLIDLSGMRGTGAAFEPLGLVNLPNVNSVAIGVNGGNITLNALQDIQTEIDSSNIMTDRQAWIMHARAFGQIRRLRDNDGRPLVEPNVKLRDEGALLGAPVFLSNQLPRNLTKGTGVSLTEIIYGRFPHLMLVNWFGGAEIKISEEASDGTNHAFVQDETWFRLIWTYDWVSEHDQAYGVIPDASSVAI